MGRHGRSDRGSKTTRKARSKDGNYQHRAKVQRRKEARDRRVILRNMLLRRVASATARSRLGLASCNLTRIQHYVFGSGIRTSIYATVDGICKYRLLDDGVSYKISIISNWHKVDDHRLEELSKCSWDPVQPKSPLEWLAEAADEE